MKFLLFSKISFEVTDPIALIESYCFQSDFYANYDLLLPNRKIGDVSKIGARTQKELLQKCEKVIESTNLAIFKYDNLDAFLGLDDETLGNHVEKVGSVIRKLMKIDGIGLSKASKILHTLYPSIIPMIDGQLQDEYRRINTEWKDDPYRILLDYYSNLKKEPNQRNLTEVFDIVSKNLPCLTKVRVFDILWWSFLKAKTLKERKGINWSTIK